MSLLTSLASGTTGLTTASEDLSVISDNIANSGTVGFKQGRADFEDALAQSVIGGSGQIGLGSQLQAVQKIMTDGALDSTGVSTDLALQGNGFFAVSGTAADGLSGTYLTRNGEFTVDQTGYLVNQDGLRVQGYGADALGNITSALGDLQVGNASSAPAVTQNVTLKANLDAGAALQVAPWDPTNAAALSNFSTSLTAYDALGASHQIQIYFQHTSSGAGGGTWDWHAVTDGAGVQGGAAGTPVDVGDGTLSFDNTGKLSAISASTVAFTPTGAAPLSFNINFGGATGAGGTGLDGVTQFAAASATTYVGQDGYASGQLSSIQIDKSGVVQGIFTNGQTRAIGQVGVAIVAAPDQLQRSGGNLYAVSPLSGQVVMGTAGDGGRGFISSGTLEQSNVDISEQFVQMIAAQRAFEANSKTITTSDTLLSELIQMKR